MLDVIKIIINFIIVFLLILILNVLVTFVMFYRKVNSIENCEAVVYPFAHTQDHLVCEELEKGNNNDNK